MMNSLTIGEKGLELIKSFEGLRLRAYLCPAKVWTIGYGHTGDVRGGQVITQSQADDLLKQDLRRFEIAVRKLVKVPLTQNQFDALVSFAYNVGEAALSRSTLLRKLNAGDLAGTKLEFAKWNKGGGKVLAGLTRRRADEATLFGAA